MSTLSIVIAVGSQTRGFKSFLSRLMQAVSGLNGSEIIVVDGSADPGVATACRSYGVCFVRAGGGHLAQMTCAATRAQGDYFLFMGVDTTLPANFAEVWRNIRREGHIWGFFALRFGQAPLKLRWLARILSVRSRISGIALEEQPLFVQRNAWRLTGDLRDDHTGGYGRLCRRLRVITPPCVTRQAVESDSARWRHMGWWATVLASILLRMPEVRERVEREVPVNGQARVGRKRTPELP